jgi:hypothetical protein
MRQINEAYEILGDVEKRKDYDSGATDFGYQYDFQKRANSVDDRIIELLIRCSTLNEINVIYLYSSPLVSDSDLDPSL